MDTLKFEYRSISSLDEIKYKNYDDCENYIEDGELKSKILINNPFIKSSNEIFQILAIIENNVAGSEIHFPIQLILNNKTYNSITGSSLSVSTKYRKYGIGTSLTSQRINYSESDSVLLGNASKMHIPIQQKLGSAVFLIPRYIYLKKSKPVLEMFLNGKLLNATSAVADLVLKVFNKIQKYRANKKVKSLTIELCDNNNIPKEINKIIELDNHKYKENHNNEWIKWIANNSFNTDSRSKQSVYVIKKDKEIVAFFITKERFYKQASHRGFKNVMLGSVIEWGTKDENIISEKDLLFYSIFTFGENISAIEICSDNKGNIRKLKRNGLIKVGEANAILRIGENSPLLNYSDIREQDKWRIRPCMGDSALS